MTSTTAPPFTGAVFIATSLDGYIARPDGGIDWLTDRADAAGETGYDAFWAGIDCMVMGRGTYEKARSFDDWPYTGRPVFVRPRLSRDSRPRRRQRPHGCRPRSGCPSGSSGPRLC